MDKTDRLRDYGLAFLLYEQGLGICGYELIRELFIFIKLILNSYLIELRKHGLRYDVEKSIKVYYDDYVVGEYKADIIVEDMLILELKAVQSLSTAHSVQLVNYLTATGIDDGLLVNFGADKIEIKHKYRVYTPQFK